MEVSVSSAFWVHYRQVLNHLPKINIMITEQSAWFKNKNTFVAVPMQQASVKILFSKSINLSLPLIFLALA